ncbi:hypothetical protein PC129_g6125 [Phytophthora cactorum]|uniref:Uncharacterized protein n=1 Tax=Phytophthora cactorum TaxID=29920 RepID=A0A329ST19_9STRA|nr:hypothetical protein Pcac1_g22386 [Phytophthora cactorum]KAG2826778.1 hypothetical protein PC111_g8833 [Phytophthora cactorum]KAG2827693.1 hypothetical protein PC112_g8761 [Phytophthora cactorum]KAG2857888.1 hypothetical protein PC113_g10282 [Phytophthora cactorum]KAG2907220.1 hypothetical protein PC114_g10878 [Phytophthora cactorum]
MMDHQLPDEPKRVKSATMWSSASSTCGESWVADKLIGSWIWESSDGLPSGQDFAFQKQLNP